MKKFIAVFLFAFSFETVASEGKLEQIEASAKNLEKSLSSIATDLGINIEAVALQLEKDPEVKSARTKYEAALQKALTRELSTNKR